MTPVTTTRPVFTNPLAEVVLEPVVVAGKDTGKMAVMVQDDSGEFQHQAMNSGDYKLLKNSLALQVGEDMMSRSPFAWEQMPTHDVWSGKFMARCYRTTDLTVELPAVGDAIALGLRIENSYDGSTKFRASLMAYVLSCLNGMTSPQFFESYTFRHLEGREEFDVSDISMKLEEGLSVLERVAPMIQELSETPLSASLITSAASSLSIPGHQFMGILKAMDLREEKRQTEWDFMQAMTYRTTHKMKGYAALKHSEEVGSFFLRRASAAIQ